jgi:hypothetical protein
MTQAGKISVFISYARKDGSELALRLRRDLEKKGSLVWLDKVCISGGASWTEEIERGIDKSQVVLAVLTRGSYVSDICRAEQLRSLRKGKKVIPLLATPDADHPLHLETKNYRDFTRQEDYSERFDELLQDMQTGKDTVVLKEHYRQTYVTAPPLPRNYVERPEALVNLRNALITEDAGPSTALTALLGMGGIGKTILAQALGRDEVVQQAFPDGIAWTTVGKEAAHDLVSRMQEVRRALGDEPGDKEAEKRNSTVSPATGTCCGRRLRWSLWMTSGRRGIWSRFSPNLPGRGFFSPPAMPPSPRRSGQRNIRRICVPVTYLLASF